MEYMFKVVHDLAPTEVRELFTLVRDTHGRQTRSATGLELVIPNPRLKLCKKDIRYRGPLYWNMVDTSIKQSDSFLSFKNALRTSDLFQYE